MPGHDHSAMAHGLGIAPGLPLGALMLALFLAGLTGGLTHCAGMCGSFVLAQVGSNLSRVPAAGFNIWARLRGALLLPYHLGRMTTYVAFGMAAGGLVGAFAELTAFKGLQSALLLVAAALFLLQLAAELVPLVLRGRHLPGFAPGGRLGAVGAALSRLVAPYFADPRGWRGYVLGVALGFLPCGLIYSAVAAAAGGGSVPAGGLAMAAFVAGTALALMLVGYGGAIVGQRWRFALRPVARSLMAVNAAILVWIAVGTLS